MSVNLRKGKDTGIPINKPTQIIYQPVKKEDGLTDEDQINIKIEQEGYAMEYTIDIKEWKARQNTYIENKFKAYTIIFGYCNKTMQNRIEEAIDFEMNIQNDPFLLLENIKMKMYGQVRAKYEFVQPTETITQFISLKQDHGESLIEYSKRFKQSIHNLKAVFGKDFHAEYIKKLMITRRE
jgi:hypothetical protein